jgi:hypothetical protein
MVALEQPGQFHGPGRRSRPDDSRTGSAPPTLVHRLRFSRSLDPIEPDGRLLARRNNRAVLLVELSAGHSQGQKQPEPARNMPKTVVKPSKSSLGAPPG